MTNNFHDVEFIEMAVFAFIGCVKRNKVTFAEPMTNELKNEYLDKKRIEKLVAFGYLKKLYETRRPILEFCSL